MEINRAVKTVYVILSYSASIDDDTVVFSVGVSNKINWKY